MSDIEPIQAPSDFKSEASRMLWMSMAYVESSLVLCDRMIEDDLYREYTYTQVVLHLSRHAFELFLKAVIWNRSGNVPPKTHRLDKLYRQYEAIFPGEKFSLDPPFTRQLLENPDSGLFPNSLSSYHKSHDQRFRYSHDALGAPFVDKEPFDVIAYRASIFVFRTQMQGILLKIEWDIDIKSLYHSP